MKKLNSRGFGAIEAILIVVIVGLIAGVGYYVYRQSQKQDETSQPQSSTNATDTISEPESTESNIDTTIHKVDIKLKTTADISKLPEFTPASFKAYMIRILKSNKYNYNSVDGVDTIAEYHIDKISQVNIIGGLVPVDKNGEGHAGGAPIIWVLTPNDTWDEESLNGPVCKSKNGGLIYEEFVKECYIDPNTDSLVKNPNGSIKSIND